MREPRSRGGGSAKRAALPAPAGVTSRAHSTPLLDALDAAEQPYPREEEARVKRFDDVIVGAGLEASDFILDGGAARKQHDGQVHSLGQRANVLAEREPTLTRQVDLADEQVGQTLRQVLDGLVDGAH